MDPIMAAADQAHFGRITAGHFIGHQIGLPCSQDLLGMLDGLVFLFSPSDGPGVEAVGSHQHSGSHFPGS